jgi:hypothetical protein
MAYARRTASAEDYFVAGDSGAGYVNPGHVQAPRVISGLPSGVAAWRAHCERHYDRWDLSVTGFIIDGYAPAMSEAMLDAYAAFSPDGIAAQKVPQRTLHAGMPVVRMDHDVYLPVEKAAATVLARLPEGKPVFRIFRTILWRPSELKRLADAVEEAGEDVVVVDPYRFFALAKRASEASEAAGEELPEAGRP